MQAYTMLHQTDYYEEKKVATKNCFDWLRIETAGIKQAHRVSVSLGSDFINGLSGTLDSKPTADELHICLPIVSTITRHLGKRYGTTLHTSIQ